MENSDYSHKIGEYIVYKNNGICRITDIRKERFPKMRDRVYYVCSPIYDMSSRVFIPADSKDAEKGMRRILTAEEIDGVIFEAEEIDEDFNNTGKERTAVYEEKLSGGDTAEILWLIKSIMREKNEREHQKKKLYAADARILSAAEKIIEEEFAFALGISKKEVIPYIISRVRSKQ